MRAFLAIALVLGLAVMSQAATVTLTVVADENAKTWEAFAELDNVGDNDGISSMWIDVTADGNLAIESSTSGLTRGTDGSFKNWGFTQFTSDGVKGIGIRGGQQTTSVGDTVLTNFGFAGGSMANINPGLGPNPISWTVAALIASGTYSGDSGTIYVDTHEGAQVNLLDQGRNAGATGGVHAAETVLGGSVPVPIPEPSTFVLLGLAGFGLLLARRRR